MKKTESQLALEALATYLAPVETDLRQLQEDMQRCYNIASAAYAVGDVEEAVWQMKQLNGLQTQYWALEAANIAYLNRIAALRLGALNAREVRLTLQEFSVSN
jgi:hypothetical protein